MDARMQRGVRRIVAVGVAGATFGVLGASAVAEVRDAAPARWCAPTESDLLRAADGARQLEAQRPELFRGADPRATSDDLRLAAEWARRMSHLHPVAGCGARPPERRSAAACPTGSEGATATVARPS